MKRLLLAGVLALLPFAAQARQWYVLNAGQAKCETAVEASYKFNFPFSTPEEFIHTTNRMGIYAGVQTARAKDGAVAIASVKLHFTNGSTAMITFTTQMVYCQALLKLGERDGSIVPPNELR